MIVPPNASPQDVPLSPRPGPLYDNMMAVVRTDDQYHWEQQQQQGRGSPRQVSQSACSAKRKSSFAQEEYLATPP